MSSSCSVKKSSFRSIHLLTVFLLVLAVTVGAANAELLVYEPFDYQSTKLTGQGGALGTVGTWNSNDSLVAGGWVLHQQGESSGIVQSGLNASIEPYGTNKFVGTVANLYTSGGYAGYNEGGGHLTADIALLPSVTATFQPGGTTWISYVSVRAWDRNEEQANLVLGTIPAPSGSRGDNYGGIGTGGSGFGTGGGPTRNNRTGIYPMFYDAGQYRNVNGAIPDNSYREPTYEVAPGDGLVWEELNPEGYFGGANIVVMKLEWDADSNGEDIISVASFLEDDVLSESAFDDMISSKTNLCSASWSAANKPNLNQSQLDTITFMGIKFFVDEIRIGTAFDSVVPYTGVSGKVAEGILIIIK